MKVTYLPCLIILVLYFITGSSIAGSPGDGKHLKLVIIRADDICNINPEVKWLSDLVLKEDLKATFAVIPARLGPKDIVYLGNLDRDHFELAAHGYNHESLKGLPYKKQYDIINKSTNAMETYFHIRPYTFIPPFEAIDDNTVKACYDLGYHSILMSYDTQTAKDMKVLRKFSWELEWNPLEHSNFTDFKRAFDSYYNSSADAFLIILHPATFDINKKLDQKLVSDFNRSVYYMRSKNVKFETMEDMYEQAILDKEFQCFAYKNKNFFEI